LKDEFHSTTTTRIQRVHPYYSASNAGLEQGRREHSSNADELLGHPWRGLVADGASLSKIASSVRSIVHVAALNGKKVAQGVQSSTHAVDAGAQFLPCVKPHHVLPALDCIGENEHLPSIVGEHPGKS
jgi:hypothetical protein